MYGVSVCTVDRFVRESRKDPCLLRRLFQEQNKIDDLKTRVEDFILLNMDDKTMMQKASHISSSFNKQNDCEINDALVIEVLTKKLNMGYKKIIKISPHANTVLSIVTR